MRHYEMMLILSDELDEAAAHELIERVETSIADSGGTVEATDFWGKRPFAYEIDHRTAGWYAVFDFELGAEGLAEVERQLKINDAVVRFKTLRPDVRVRKPKAPRVRTYS